MTVDMMDIDIDMGDMDDMGVDDVGREDGGMTDAMQTPQSEALTNISIPTGPADPESRIPVPSKVHLRGLDDIQPEHIEALAMEYYSSEMYERIEWIDDSSANLVYANSEVALNALKAFAAIEIGDISQMPIQQMFPGKAFPGKPEVVLQVRLAVLSDKKQPRAHERSRFYLLNPNLDPKIRNYRQRDQGRRRHADDPKSQNGRRNRYNSRFQDDEDSTFNESYYDDDQVSISSRRRADRSSHGSFSSSEGRGARATRGVGRELFPDRAGRGAAGRLRNRSSSPSRDRSASPAKDRSRARGERYAFSRENRRKAQILKENLQARRSPVTKELFPHKAMHRRSDAFDAAVDETAELFAHKMAVPLMDGNNDLKLRKQGSGGFSIRGAAKQQSSGGFSIKGAARASTTKELFPSRSNGSNAGKELFAGKLDGRGTQRRRAEDLFY